MYVMFVRLVRTGLLLFLMLTCVALVLARMSPLLESRELGAPPLLWVNPHFLGRSDTEILLVEPQTSQTWKLKTSGSDLIDLISASPWYECEGTRQIVGRWAARTGTNANAVSQEFGITRLRFPTGEILDQIPLDVLPISPPCWLPRTEATVLYAGTDGSIHKLDFEPSSSEASRSSTRPIPLRWEATDFSDRPMRVLDVQMPELLGPSRIVLATIFQSLKHSASPKGRTELWWLRLSPGLDAIEAAGKLVPEDWPEATLSLRRPVLGNRPDGTTELACLADAPGRKGFDLLLFNLTLDPVRRIPRLASPSRLMSRGTHLATPTFSADGERLLYVKVGEPSNSRVIRARLSKRPQRQVMSTESFLNELAASLTPQPDLTMQTIKAYTTTDVVGLEMGIP